MASSSQDTPSRGRGRSNRGGLGKYLRAKGRKGYGRPAEFNQRLVLEGEQEAELDPDEQKDLQTKYSRRQLESNASRYEEKPPSDEGVFFSFLRDRSVLSCHRAS